MEKNRFILEVLSTTAVLLSLYSATENKELRETFPLIMTTAFVIASILS